MRASASNARSVRQSPAHNPKNEITPERDAIDQVNRILRRVGAFTQFNRDQFDDWLKTEPKLTPEAVWALANTFRLCSNDIARAGKQLKRRFPGKTWP
jgi:hypothetical protein